MKQLIIGVDECGYGSIAGPVVAGAALWDKDYCIEGLNDSKKLNLKQRLNIFNRIREAKIIFAIGSANVDEIERLNVYHATHLAMKRAIDLVLDKTKIVPDIILIDGRGHIEGLDIKQKWIIKGDEKKSAIMAASVVAKVLRDNYMKELVIKNPEYEVYGWQTNVGYGTKKHLEAIKKYGITTLHRKTFQPIKDQLKKGALRWNILKKYTNKC